MSTIARAPRPPAASRVAAASTHQPVVALVNAERALILGGPAAPVAHLMEILTPTSGEPA